MPIKEYVASVEKRYAKGGQTEMSYRTDLENLLKTLQPKLEITQEPSTRGSDLNFGRPDYVLALKGKTIGYIETKSIGDKDLEGKRKRGGNKEQFDRYKEALGNIIFTDYLHFILYREGEAVRQARVAEVLDGKVTRLSNGEKELTDLLECFASYAGLAITQTKQLAKAMAGKARLMANVMEQVLEDDIKCFDQAKAQGKSYRKAPLYSQLEVFRSSLISDLDPKTFADVYAQTIAYGLFAARFNDSSLGDFSREEAAKLIPKSNPFLRRLFNHIAGNDIDDRIRWIVEELVDIFRLCDMQKVMKQFYDAKWSEDPIIHFYEDFLASYDKETRKGRGVWYTPQPIVSFMVKAVDSILRKHFDLSKGLADASTIKVERTTQDSKPVQREYHKVQILDPATGTGTFLAEIVRQIADKFKKSGQEGMWQGYVTENLIPRLHGFEILMASYAMAHLKLDMVLRETGYTLGEQSATQRLGIYLTNTLEEELPERGIQFSEWLSEEAYEANRVKREVPVMVIIGNPPYSGESANKGKWIEEEMKEYKWEPGGVVRLKEQNSKWINDDYVKFIRFSEGMIEKNGSGILAFINPHGYLDNPTFRGMRWHLLRTFDEIYLLDLHGNARKKETAPDGTKDENVFNIQQGVSINLFIKSGKKSPEALGKVYHADLYGERSEKYSWLSNTAPTPQLFQEVEYSEPFYFFAPKSTEGLAEYKKGFGVSELMPINSVGITTARDSFTIHFSREQLVRTIETFLELGDEEARGQFALGKDSRDWKVSLARNDLKANYPEKGTFTKISYRPFDEREVFYTGKTKGFHCMPRRDTMRHFLAGDNLGLCCSRQVKAFTKYQHALITNNIMDSTYVSGKTSEGSYVFPLYLYPEEGGLLLAEGRVPNLNDTIVAQIAERIGLHFRPEETGEDDSFAPIDLLDYIYAILHHPKYRERYFEFLKVDFPRIPYPKSEKQFRDFATIGKELRQLHLLTSRWLDRYLTSFPQGGENLVEQEIRDENGRVWINDKQYFKGVSQAVWEFYIGGYQPAQKWLKDRRGTKLSFNDLCHYQRMITALACTITQMAQLEKISF